MPRFFIAAAPLSDTVTLTGSDAHHLLRVLRMKSGDTLTLCDGAGTDYDCVLEAAAQDTALCRIRDKTPSAGEPDLAVSIYTALPKSDKMDLVVQKAVELGVMRIVPFLGARSIVRPDEKSMEKKRVRWQKIASEAACQCGRGRIPIVEPLFSFRQAVQDAARMEQALLFYECERQVHLKDVLAGQHPASVALMIGPEGGFAANEVKEAKENGLTSVSLGARILRCETAPLAALAAVMYESGNF
jgi:16S rRNA (uracil1498-N3)-methyltransferase